MNQSRMRFTLVSETTLMESETPVRDFSRGTGNFRILLRHLGRVGFTSGKEVEIQDTTNDVVFQRGPIGIVDFDIHTV